VNLTVTDALQKLQAKNEILYAEPNYKLKLLSTLPDDTRFNELWAMHNTGQSGGTADADIDAIECVQYAVDKGAKVLSNSWQNQIPLIRQNEIRRNFPLWRSPAKPGSEGGPQILNFQLNLTLSTLNLKL
jgi:hypothetical protein